MKFKIWLEDEEENKLGDEIRDIILSFIKSSEERAELDDEDVLNQRSTMSIEDKINDILNRGTITNHVPASKIEEIRGLATEPPGITIGRFIDELVSAAENLPTAHSRIDPSDDESLNADPRTRSQAAVPGITTGYP